MSLSDKRKFGLFAAFAIAAAGMNGVFVYKTGDQVTFTVTDKERIVERSGKSSKYLVFTDKEVFENTDSFFRWKFNSSDVQGQLVIGGTYECDVYGNRTALLNTYRNIVDCTEISAPPSPPPPSPPQR